MTTTGQYEWVLRQNKGNSTLQLENVSGTDVMNLARRPVIYSADDESPWNCRCESKAVLTTAENILKWPGVLCNVCVKPVPVHECCVSCFSVKFTSLTGQLHHFQMLSRTNATFGASPFVITSSGTGVRYSVCWWEQDQFSIEGEDSATLQFWTNIDVGGPFVFGLLSFNLGTIGDSANYFLTGSGQTTCVNPHGPSSDVFVPLKKTPPCSKSSNWTLCTDGGSGPGGANVPATGFWPSTVTVNPIPCNATPWANATAYEIDDIVSVTGIGTRIYICTAAGTSTTSPSGETFTDGSLHWSYM